MERVIGILIAVVLNPSERLTTSPYCRTWTAVRTTCCVCSISNYWNNQLENVSITNALKPEAARRRAVPIHFNFVARAKFEVAQPIRCRLRAFLLLIRYVTLWSRDLDLWPLTLNICSVPAEPWSNSVQNLSEIGQFAAELLQFEYLTLWPWICITCCVMLWDSLHKV